MTPSIRKFLAAALLMLIGGVFCIAQQAAGSCSTYFVMYQFDQKLGLILFPALTVDQAKWLEKKGRKKYPSYCVDVDKATYVMVTFRWTEEKQQTSTKTRSAYTRGPVPAVVGLSSSGPGNPAQPIWGTQIATFVTTWQENETEIIPEPHALILTFATKDGKPLSATTELKPEPVTRVKGVGRKGSKDALETTLEFLELMRKAHANDLK